MFYFNLVFSQGISPVNQMWYPSWRERKSFGWRRSKLKEADIPQRAGQRESLKVTAHHSFSVLGNLLSTQQPQRLLGNICHIMPLLCFIPSADVLFHSKQNPKYFRGLEGPGVFARSPGFTILHLFLVISLFSMLPDLPISIVEPYHPEHARSRLI